MTTNFPTSKDVLTNPNATDKVSTVSHSAQHTNANDAIEALQTKVGINGSAVTSTHDYKLSSVAEGEKAIATTGNQSITGTLEVTGALTSDGLDAGSGDINTTGNVTATNVALNDAKVSADGSIDTHSDVDTSGKSNSDILTYQSSSGKWVAQAPASNEVETAVFQEQYAANTASVALGTTWTTKILNTTVFNNSANISLSSNQVTLQAGTYRINAYCSIYFRKAKTRFYNVSDSTADLIGTSVTASTSNQSTPNSIINGVVTVASAKTFALQTVSNAADGKGGNPVNLLSTPEVYAQLEITKIA